MKKNILCTCILLALAGCGGSEEGSTGNGTSSSNTQPNKISVSRTSLEIKEGDTVNTNEKFTFTATRNAEKNIVVSFKTFDGTAKAGQDYVGVDSTVTILEGSRTAEVTLSTIANNIHQPNREFTFKITNVAPQGGKVELVSDTAVIRIMDDDPEPIVNFTNAKITAHEDIGTVNLPIQLDRQSSKETLVKLTLKGIATRDTDFAIDSLDLKIPPMTSKIDLPVKIVKDALVEGTETIELTMSQISNAKLGQQLSSTIFISGDLRLPDTGVVTYYYNGNFNSKVPDSNHPYQDASYGHDIDPRYASNGVSGFVYQKVDIAGNSLPVQTNKHLCTYDAHTGLTWEVKSGNPSTEFETVWNNERYRYLWLDTNKSTNGGSDGGINDEEFSDFTKPFSSNCQFPPKGDPLHMGSSVTKGCTSASYITLYNTAAMCGFKDWRLPTIFELASIADYQHKNVPLDPEYFPDAQTHIANTTREVKYLSSTPSAENTASVWCYDARSKAITLCNKQTYNSIRLVRGPKL